MLTTEDVIRIISIQASTTELTRGVEVEHEVRESMYAENWIPVYLPDK